MYKLLGAFILVMVALTAAANFARAEHKDKHWHATGWNTVAEMNRMIDQTNFIVENGCSGTLISVKYRLIVTAHHCVNHKIKTVKRKIADDDGKVKEVEFQRLDRVTVTQRDYDRFDNIGAVSYQTEILAYKQERDLALLQLVGDNLRSTMAAPVLRDGKEVMRGQGVIAVGNPRLLDASVTVGVISSTSRTFRVPWALSEQVPLLQFDANIQPGSSGGALFTNDGVYIGTTVAAFPGSDLSLAVPVYELQDLLLEECMATIYNPDADDDKCRADKEKAEKEGQEE